jgi:hypothetical protein
MNHPGTKDLGDITVTAAGTQTTEWTDEPDGVTAVTSQARFAYRTGGIVAWSLSRPPTQGQRPNGQTSKRTCGAQSGVRRSYCALGYLSPGLRLFLSMRLSTRSIARRL